MTLQPDSTPDPDISPSWLYWLARSEIRLNSFLSQQPRYEESFSLLDFLRRLKYFWELPQASANSTLSHRERLTQLLAAQMKMIERHSNMPTMARALVERCYADRRSVGQASWQGFQLTIATRKGGRRFPLLGMFVLTQDGPATPLLSKEPVVLAELGQPWRSFASGPDLWQWLLSAFDGTEGKARLLRNLPFKYQSSIGPLAERKAFDLSKFDLVSQVIGESPFAFTVRGLLDQQRQAIEYQIAVNRRHGLPQGTDLDKAADLRTRFSVGPVVALYRNVNAQAYAETALRTLQSAPDMYAQGRRYIKEQVKQLTGQEVNPDRIYLHYFGGAVSSHESYNGWTHPGSPSRSLTLTQLALANFSAEDESSDPGVLDLVAGFYTEGPDSTKGYGVHNEFRLLPSRLMALDWTRDFYTEYKASLDRYWQDHGDDYRALLKGRFIAVCRAECRQGRLSLEDYHALMACAVPGLDLRSGVTLAQLNASQRGIAHGTVRCFDLYGYRSTDILHFVLAGDRQFLYLPDVDHARLIRFTSTERLQTWVLEQARDRKQRAQLVSHFSLYLRQDGKTYSGVDSALQGLADGRWSPAATIDRDDSPIDGDVFSHLLSQTRERQYSDADTLIQCNGELNEKLWIANLSAFEQVVLPMVPVSWPLGLATAAAGVALLGLGIDRTVNGDSLAERRQGAWTAFIATLDLLCSAGGGEAEDPFTSFEDAVTQAPYSVPEQTLDGCTMDADGVYRLDSNAWYVRQGEQVYRITVRPIAGMVAVIRPEGDVASPLFFLKRVESSGQWERLGLKGGQPIVENPHVRQHVKFGLRSADAYGAEIDTYLFDVAYDLQKNVFRKVAPNWANNSWETIDSKFYRAQAEGMVEVSGGFAPTNVERMATLKALDIDIQLPIDDSQLNLAAGMDIPAQIYHIWVGDRAISPELLENIGANSTIARQGARPYTLKIYLSSEHPEVFALNKTALAAQAPTAEVIELETSEFYQAFRLSPYFEQYRAAVEGNGGVARNFASASDALRYQLMKYHGGLYLDVDDSLTSAWGSAEIKTTADGLALTEPVSNSTLGLDIGFNTSCFGTQKGNPTLEAISAESFERYRAFMDIYRTPRPVAGTAPNSAFNAYMKRIAHISGPGVFNDVIDERLPGLRRLKALCLLGSRPMFVDERIIAQVRVAVIRNLPLGTSVDIGSEHSWLSSR